MITKKIILIVRKLKPWTPGEKKSVFLYSFAYKMIANVVGFQIILS